MGKRGQKRGRKIKQIPAMLPKRILRGFENGESLKKLAKEYKMGNHFLYDRLLQMIGKEKYNEIMDRRRQIPKKTLSGFKNGAPLAKLAKEHEIPRTTLKRRLLQAIGDGKFNEIMDSRKEPGIPATLLKEILGRLRNGETLRGLAKEYGIPYTTLRHRLLQLIGEERFSEITDKRRMRTRQIAPTLLKEAARRLKTGEPLIKLAKEYKIPLTTLHRRLPQTIGKEKYNEIMEQAKPLKRKTPPIHISPEARREGADSMLELGVKKLLKKHGVRFKFHENLKVRGHWYIADFMLDRTIIEVSGVTMVAYWKHYNKKLKDYIRAGYKVYVTMPNHVHKIARKYLPKHRVTVIKIKDFEKNIEEILRQTKITTKHQTVNDNTSLKEVPITAKSS